MTDEDPRSPEPATTIAMWLWTELHDLFDTDDGSSPEIHVDYSDPGSAPAGFAWLRSCATHVATKDACFWSCAGGRTFALDSVPNAAVLVADGRAEPFHVTLAGVQVRGTAIPDLGVFVFPDQLALDYPMGPEWEPMKLQALFGLLTDLTGLDPRSTLSLQSGVPEDVVARFQRAWERWSSEGADGAPDWDRTSKGD